MEQPDDNDVIVCRCEGVTVGDLDRAVAMAGAVGVNQTKKLTRAGMGLCQGRTCARLVEQYLARVVGTPPGAEAYTSRPPVRHLAIRYLADQADDFAEPAGPVGVIMTRVDTPEPDQDEPV